MQEPLRKKMSFKGREEQRTSGWKGGKTANKQRKLPIEKKKAAPPKKPKLKSQRHKKKEKASKAAKAVGKRSQVRVRKPRHRSR